MMKSVYVITDDRDITSRVASLAAERGEQAISFTGLQPFLEYVERTVSPDQKRFVPSLENGHRPNLKEVEQMYINETVQYCDGNLSKAARILGISRSTLYRHIDVPEKAN